MSLLNKSMSTSKLTNHLLRSEYILKWQDLSYDELEDKRNIIQTKINAIQDSRSVIKSLSEIIDLLDSYMKERLLAKK